MGRRWGKADFQALKDLEERLAKLEQVDFDRFCREAAADIAHHIRGQKQLHALGHGGNVVFIGGGQVFKGQLAWLIFQKRHFLKVSQVGVQMNGLDFEAAIKQIQEGDTNTVFAVGEGSLKFIETVNHDFTTGRDHHIRGQKQLHALGHGGNVVFIGSRRTPDSLT